MPTEADTCRTLITPKLQAAGWEDDPHCIAEQRTFTDGRIIVHGSTARRRPGKRADYILDYTGTATRNFADPAFDGDPAFATQEEIDEYGKVKETEVLTPEEPESVEPDQDSLGEDHQPSPLNSQLPARKYYFDGGQVQID